MGIYDNDIFCGTDKLSMAVNKDFIKYVLLKKRNILFEGDRLFSLNNLELIEKHYKTKVIILENDSILLKERHEERNDAQSERFIKGRYTKIRNIKNNLKDIELHSLKNLNDTSVLVDKITKFL